MKSIGSMLLVMCASSLALGVTPQRADARMDHLVCYKAVDKLQVTAAFDLFAELQPEFSAKGCRIVKVDDFCVPSSKLNVQPPTADTRADIAGPPLDVDYVGYLVKCEQQLAPPNKVVIDQFGTHRQGRYKVAKVYVPAKKGPPPCGTVDGKSCGGVCPDTGDECRIVDANGTCRCAPANGDVCGGKPDKQGVCGGPCPDPTNRCQLTQTPSGAKVCACGPPPPPLCGLNAATGTCGGECPNKADKCVPKSTNECTCAPADEPCALIAGSVPVCGGDCPIAGDVCELDGADDCRCGAPPPSPCGQNSFTGACGGECPTGQRCSLDSANNCRCGPVPCGSNANGQCGGSCPNTTSQTCKPDASGACNCDPPSCGRTGEATCGGACGSGTACTQVTSPAGFLCRCQ